nr:methyltransferase domain-containing protein [uncultured Pseudodesulfovibrio sp.]
MQNMSIEERKNRIIETRLKAGSYRHPIAIQIPEGSSRILEYGFGDASLLLGLERDNACREMYGIEVNPNWIKNADGLLEKTWLIDLNDKDSWLESEFEQYFNFILAPMSLEHTYDPWYVLKKFNKYLAVGGKVVLEIPNVQSWSCLYNILTGDFPYVSGGTWDYTHIRWYTLKSFIDVAFVAGFQASEYFPNIPQQVDLSHLEARKDLRVLRLPPPELGLDVPPIDIALPYDIRQTYPLFLAPSLIVTLQKEREPEDYDPTPSGGYLESYRLNTPNPLGMVPPLIAHPIVPSSFEKVMEKAKKLREELNRKGSAGD